MKNRPHNVILMLAVNIVFINISSVMGKKLTYTKSADYCMGISFEHFIIPGTFAHYIKSDEDIRIMDNGTFDGDIDYTKDCQNAELNSIYLEFMQVRKGKLGLEGTFGWTGLNQWLYFSDKVSASFDDDITVTENSGHTLFRHYLGFGINVRYFIRELKPKTFCPHINTGATYLMCLSGEYGRASVSPSMKEHGSTSMVLSIPDGAAVESKANLVNLQTGLTVEYAFASFGMYAGVNGNMLIGDMLPRESIGYILSGEKYKVYYAAKSINASVSWFVGMKVYGWGS